jgi:UDP-N-acetylglucosamine 3-dehydrogenase
VTARSRSPADVRVGIIGCGRAAASLHLPALGRTRGVVVLALSDIDPARLRMAASQHEGATCYGDYDGLLADQRIDLVAVCVPAMLHADVAEAAFSAGKHVFIEKPLALTLADSDRLAELARLGEGRGIRSVVGFNVRAHRLVRRARDIIRSGRLGSIEGLRTLWTADWTGATRPPWHDRREHGGGALLEIGSHQADLWRWLLDSEVESIHALSRSTAFDDQTAVFQTRMVNGVLVSAMVSQHTTSQNLVEVFGERGSLRLSCYHGDSLEVTMADAPARGAWRRIGPLFDKASRLPGALNSARHGGDFRMSYQRQWEHIAEALRTGRPMPATVHDGRQAVRIVLAALQSSQEGCVVSVNPVEPVG